MAYQSNSAVVISDDFAGSFANVTIQNNGFLEVNSSDGFQGTVAGYVGNFNISGNSDNIDKFPFATDTNATNVGSLASGRRNAQGLSSTTHGYVGGGYNGSVNKFPFAVDTNAGLLALGSYTSRNQAASISSPTKGYTGGGSIFDAADGDNFTKFIFATDAVTYDVFDFADTHSGVGRSSLTGHSSTTHGYVSGGFINPPTSSITNIIEKFPFATDTNATDVGDLSQARRSVTGQSSTTFGYTSGGNIPTPNTPPIVNTIEKFPFATDTNATDIGDLTQARTQAAGQSSTSDGYTSGGISVFPFVGTNIIDKFPFAADLDATDVGDLTRSTRADAGIQD